MPFDSEAEYRRLRLRMVWASSKLSGVERRVLDVLDIESVAGANSDACEIRPRVIAQRVGASVRAVNKALKSLRERGFIRDDRFQGVIELRHDIPDTHRDGIDAWVRRLGNRAQPAIRSDDGTVVPLERPVVPHSGTRVPDSGTNDPLAQHTARVEPDTAADFEAEQVAAAQLKFLIPILADALATRTALPFRVALEELLGVIVSPSKLARAMASLIVEISAGGIPLNLGSRQIVGRSPREQVLHAMEYPYFYRFVDPDRLLQVFRECARAEGGNGSSGSWGFLRHAYINTMQIKVAQYADSLLETIKPVRTNND